MLASGMVYTGIASQCIILRLQHQRECMHAFLHTKQEGGWLGQGRQKLRVLYFHQLRSN